LQRVYQRDPEAIERWRRVSYPAIARQARTAGGEVFFRDEAGFRADAVHDGRAIRPSAAEDDAASLEAGTPGGRWTSGGQSDVRGSRPREP